MHKSEWLADKFDAVGHWHRRMQKIAASLRVSRENGWRNPVDAGPGPIPPEWSSAHRKAWEQLGDDERELLAKWRGFHTAAGGAP